MAGVSGRSQRVTRVRLDPIDAREADYGPVFAEAVGIIEEACNDVTPPG